MDLSTTKSLYTYTPFFGRLTLNNYTSLKLNQTLRTVSSVYNLKICRKSALLNMNKVMLFNPWCFGFLTLLKKIYSFRNRRLSRVAIGYAITIYIT